MPRKGRKRKGPVHADPDMPNRKKPTHSVMGEPYEYTIQQSIVKYLRKDRPDVLFTATVGGVKTSNWERKKMTTQGYSKGVPDILLFLEDRVVGIEVKRPKTYTITEEQYKWRDALFKRGHGHAFVHSLEDFLDELEKYEKPLDKE